VLVIFGSALILNIPMLSEVYLDYQDYMKGIPDQKKKDVWLRGGLIVGLSFLIAVYRLHVWSHTESYLLNVLVCVIFATGYYICLFNYLMNYFLSRKWDYLSPTSDFDMFLVSVGLTRYKLLGWQIVIGLFSTFLFLFA
jgi:hypothetical protein